MNPAPCHCDCARSSVPFRSEIFGMSGHLATWWCWPDAPHRRLRSLPIKHQIVNPVSRIAFQGCHDFCVHIHRYGYMRMAKNLHCNPRRDLLCL